MSTITALQKTIDALPEATRAIAERRLLADFARTSAFTRPLSVRGTTRFFGAASGLETESLKLDSDITCISSKAKWDAYLSYPKGLMILITKSSGITLEMAAAASETLPGLQTVFCEI